MATEYCILAEAARNWNNKLIVPIGVNISFIVFSALYCLLENFRSKILAIFKLKHVVIVLVFGTLISMDNFIDVFVNRNILPIDKVEKTKNKVSFYCNCWAW